MAFCSPQPKRNIANSQQYGTCWAGCSIASLDPVSHANFTLFFRSIICSCQEGKHIANFLEGILHTSLKNRVIKHFPLSFMNVQMMSVGKPTKLSCGEAIAAALYITGFKDAAVDVMSNFKWSAPLSLSPSLPFLLASVLKIRRPDFLPNL